MKWIRVDGTKISKISSVEIDEATPVASESMMDVGMDVREFDECWNLRPLSERVADGLIEIPRGKKLVGEAFVAMTPLERYQFSVDPVPVGMVLEGDCLRCITLAEQVTADLITQGQADEVAAMAKREERARLLGEYDKKAAQLGRSIRRAEKRGGDASAMEAELAAWDAWADALCDMPEANGWPYVAFPAMPSKE